MSIKPRTWLLDSQKDVTRLICRQGHRIIYCDVDVRPEGAQFGEIYEGKITKAPRKAALAFLTLGEGREAVLPLSERDFPRPQEGETISIQISREAIPDQDKLAMATRILEVPLGPFVWMPKEPGLRFSKKISAELRKILESQLKPLMKEGDGLLVRSHADQFSPEDLEKTLKFLQDRWARALPHKVGFFEKILALSSPQDVIEVDSLALHKKLAEAIENHPYAPQLNYSRDAGFDENLEDAWETMFAINVPIPGGGELIIEKTHAFYAIDINTGQSNQPVHVFLKKAIETALAEIRKRDLGGIILIDLPFSSKAQGDLLAYVKREAQWDLNPPQIHGITPLGILELTRKQRGQSLTDLISLK